MVIIPTVTAQVEVKLILCCSTVAYIVFNRWLFRPILRPARWVCLVLKLLCNDGQNRPGITSLRMLKISGNLQNLLAFASHPVWMTSATDHTVWMMTREWWRQSAFHLQELCTQLSIQAKCCRMWLMQAFLLKFTNRLQQHNAVSYCQSNIVSDFKTVWMCLTVSITLQCGLSAGQYQWL